MYSVEEIQALMKSLNEQGLERVKVKNGEMEVELLKSGEASAVSRKTETKVEEKNEDEVSSNEDTDIHTIKSSTVGTFYRASEPNAEPFVKEGDNVSNDTVVGVVEAMKLFNEISAEVEGEITEVLVEDGTFVEYEDELFKVRKG